MPTTAFYDWLHKTNLKRKPVFKDSKKRLSKLHFKRRIRLRLKWQNKKIKKIQFLLEIYYCYM